LGSPNPKKFVWIERFFPSSFNSNSREEYLIYGLSDNKVADFSSQSVKGQELLLEFKRFKTLEIYVW